MGKSTALLWNIFPVPWKADSIISFIWNKARSKKLIPKSCSLEPIAHFCPLRASLSTVSISTLQPSALFCTKEMESFWSQVTPQAGQHTDWASNRKGLVRKRCYGNREILLPVRNKKNPVLSFGFYCSKAHSLKSAMISWKGCSPDRLWYGRKGWNFVFY